MAALLPNKLLARLFGIGSKALQLRQLQSQCIYLFETSTKIPHISGGEARDRLLRFQENLVWISGLMVGINLSVWSQLS